jgi:hypothetical protein
VATSLLLPSRPASAPTSLRLSVLPFVSLLVSPPSLLALSICSSFALHFLSIPSPFRLHFQGAARSFWTSFFGDLLAVISNFLSTLASLDVAPLWNHLLDSF